MRRTPSNVTLLAVVAMLAALVAGVAVYVPWKPPARDGISLAGDTPDTEPLSFDGDSGKLKQTVIVPTLDTPIPDGKSAIWCLSFQIAWSGLAAEAGVPPIVDTAEEISQRLNEARGSRDDLVPDSFYAAAGSTNDGIIEQIRREMAEKFPGVEVPDTPSEMERFVSYCYLTATVKYPLAYDDGADGLAFRGPSDKTPVRSHGLTESSKEKRELRAQPKVLYLLKSEKEMFGYSDREFALDLCKESNPLQIVVARIPRKPTLAATLADLEAKITEHGKDGHPHVSRDDSLLVPNMRWRITHHFRELEHQPLKNTRFQGWIVNSAVQVIEFKMDRRGATVESAGRVEVMKDKGPSYRYHFDGPYLVYLKKRGAAHPFLVMWIDNAELLSK